MISCIVYIIRVNLIIPFYLVYDQAIKIKISICFAMHRYNEISFTNVHFQRVNRKTNIMLTRSCNSYYGLADSFR